MILHYALAFLLVISEARSESETERLLKAAAVNDSAEEADNHSSVGYYESHARPAHAAAAAHAHGGVAVAKWNFDYVSTPFIVTAFIFALVVVKLLYHKVHIISENIPESCMLILMGLAIGGLFTLDTNPTDQQYISFLIFTKEAFFLYLLPPIMLEAAYSLRDRAFIENIGTILLFAVLGTIINVFLISLGLWLFTLTGIYHLQLSMLQIMVFGSLIAAVDPVAVLAIFEEVGVNKMLYFMVFGESLLNDAVTVVLYNLMSELIVTEQVQPMGIKEIGLGVAAFLCVSLGAVFIGVVWGFLCSFVTRYTTDIRVIEPTVIFASAYMAYLCAECVEWSGIIAIICCGIVQAQYAFENLSAKSLVVVRYAIKVVAMIMESLIFIILGMMLVNHSINNRLFWYHWDTAFSLIALVLCFAVRFAVVLLLTGIVNWYTTGTRNVSFKEQLIIVGHVSYIENSYTGYGGLRGAVSFSLAFALDSSLANQGENYKEIRGMFLSATYTIILFTVFVQGITMKPLVRLLQIKLAESGPDLGGFRLFNEFHRGVVQNTLAGVEEVIGHRGEHYWTSRLKWFSQRYLRPNLQNKVATTGPGHGLLIAHEQSKSQSNVPSSFATLMLDESAADLNKYMRERRQRKLSTTKTHLQGLDKPEEIAQLRAVIDLATARQRRQSCFT